MNVNAVDTIRNTDSIDRVDLVKIVTHAKTQLNTPSEQKVFFHDLTYRVQYTDGKIVEIFIKDVRTPFSCSQCVITDHGNDDGVYMLNRYNRYTLELCVEDEAPIFSDSYEVRTIKDSDVKEMTIEEIEKKLGYKIKVIGGSEDK